MAPPSRSFSYCRIGAPSQPLKLRASIVLPCRQSPAHRSRRTRPHSCSLVRNKDGYSPDWKYASSIATEGPGSRGGVVVYVHAERNTVHDRFVHPLARRSVSKPTGSGEPYRLGSSCQPVAEHTGRSTRGWSNVILGAHRTRDDGRAARTRMDDRSRHVDGRLRSFQAAADRSGSHIGPSIPSVLSRCRSRRGPVTSAPVINCRPGLRRSDRSGQ